MSLEYHLYILQICLLTIPVPAPPFQTSSQSIAWIIRPNNSMFLGIEIRQCWRFRTKFFNMFKRLILYLGPYKFLLSHLNVKMFILINLARKLYQLFLNQLIYLYPRKHCLSMWLHSLQIPIFPYLLWCLLGITAPRLTSRLYQQYLTILGQKISGQKTNPSAVF